MFDHFTTKGTQLMSIYTIKEELYNKAPSNSEHYIKRYIKFIFSCIEENKNLPKNTYTENHHILPRCYWKEYENLTKHKWNKAKLTARQHYISHIILAKIFGGKMWLALDRMTAKSPDHNGNRNYTVHSSIYEQIRIEKSRFISESKKGLHAGDKNPMYGKKGELSPNFGLKRSEETKEKQRRARKETYKMIECPVCGVKGESRMMKVWHFDNCGKTTRNKGSKNGSAIKVFIYNQEGELMFKCNGNFNEICKENNIPRKPLAFSYRNNGTPIMTSNQSRHYAERKGIAKYIGWYAIKQQ